VTGSWFRILIGAVVAIVATVVGLQVAGTLDATPDPNTGLIAGANTFMLVLAIALLVGFIAYAAVEYAQTRRLDSISRQFDTRTIVLIPIAIAVNIVLGQTIGTALKMPIYMDSIGTILVGVLAGPIPGALTGLLANLIWTFVLSGTPFGSPYAWPFAIVAAEIGLLAGVFGYFGFFRSRPNTPTGTLVVGAVIAVGVLAGLTYFGILPAYWKGQLIGVDVGTVEPFFLAVGALIALAVALTAIVLVVNLFQRRDLGVAYIVVGGAICGVVSALISFPISAVFYGGVTGSGTDLLVAAFQKAGADLNTAVLQQGLISDPIDKTITYVVVFALLQTLSRRFTARFPQGEQAIGVVEA
jgi:energy-coupling factor transport system substrate-specific component